MTKGRTKLDVSAENERADKLTIVLIKRGRTMSDTLTMPEPNTMALGGVPTGSTKANEHASVVGNIRVNGCRDIAGAWKFDIEPHDFRRFQISGHPNEVQRIWNKARSGQKFENGETALWTLDSAVGGGAGCLVRPTLCSWFELLAQVKPFHPYVVGELVPEMYGNDKTLECPPANHCIGQLRDQTANMTIECWPEGWKAGSIWMETWIKNLGIGCQWQPPPSTTALSHIAFQVKIIENCSTKNSPAPPQYSRISLPSRCYCICSSQPSRWPL